MTAPTAGSGPTHPTPTRPTSPPPPPPPPSAAIPPSDPNRPGPGSPNPKPLPGPPVPPPYVIMDRGHALDLRIVGPDPDDRGRLIATAMPLAPLGWWQIRPAADPGMPRRGVVGESWWPTQADARTVLAAIGEQATAGAA